MLNEHTDPWSGRRRSRNHHVDRDLRDPRADRGPHRDRGRDFDFDRHGRGMGPGRGFPFGLAAMFGRGRAVRRGDVRAAILAVLADQPMHGYQVMQELRQRSDGRWAPSAGSVYPTLQQLEDEGLVRGEERNGRRVFSLTEQGKPEAERLKEAARPWEADRDPGASDPRRLALQVARATMQVYQAGSPKAIDEARRVLVATRRDLYRILAEDDADLDETAGDTGEATASKTDPA